jgi:DNA sulfur modification protein DndC
MVQQESLFVFQQPTTHLDYLLRRLREITLEIQELYLHSHLPWVIGYSGGKDSTMVVQLVYKAIAQLPEEARGNRIFIVGGNTLVEDPAMAARMKLSIERLNKAARRDKLPLSAHIVSPPTKEAFFAKVIGSGYPPPTSHFRWCTARLKVGPSTEFIQKRVAGDGETIVVLGARKAESTTRAQTMQAYQLPGSVLRRHSDLPKALVYCPIEDLSTPAVWDYLMNNQNPWGDNNRNLRALYKQDSGECPLVIDSSTPTCGNSRFGCWTCSVASHNRSLENRYDEGEVWLLPLIEFRELLVQMIDPDHKLEYRDIRQRRTNKINLTRKGEVSPRSLTLRTRQMLLRRLLEAQLTVQQEGPDPHLELISVEELAEISRIWYEEDGDWEQSAEAIYCEVMGTPPPWKKDKKRVFNGQDQDVLAEKCTKQGIPPALLQQIIEVERQLLLAEQRGEESGDVMGALDQILSKDWRPEAVVIAELQADFALKREQERGALPQQDTLW